MSLLQTADVERVLAELSRERPVFHSEADFQLALAFKMQRMYPQLAIRMDRTEIIDNKKLRIDVVAHQNGQTTLMELKYLTCALRIQVRFAEEEYEAYNIQNHAAQPPYRYKFLKDIRRLELLVERYMLKGHDAAGYAILLTNDSMYWKEPSRDEVIDYAFRLHEGRTIAGGEVLQWDKRASADTKANREQPIVLHWSYTLQWRDYSELTPPLAKPVVGRRINHGKFRYLLVRVPPRK